jgi:hypothetical protein
MFLPGYLCLLMLMQIYEDLSIYELFVKNKSSAKNCCMYLFVAFYPLAIIMFQFYSTFTCQGDVHQGYMAIGVALEAFVESFLQLVLQNYTILLGYEITWTQTLTICASFIMLSKASIDLDLEVYKHNLGSLSTSCLKHYFVLLPGYAATIAFRTSSFAITIAFLRLDAWLPMCVLVFEMCMVYCFYFGFKLASGFALVITNLGVTNVGIIGATHFIKNKTKEDSRDTDVYIKQTDGFIKLSSVTTFLHHTIVLSYILYMVINDTGYLLSTHYPHWEWEHFILKSYKGYYYEHIYWVFSGIIGVGFVGVVSTLFVGARSLKIAG